MNEQKRKFFPIKMSELMDRQFKPIDWLVDGLIPLGGITAFSGYPGSYKTWIMLDLAVRSAQGNDFLEKFKTKKVKVLIIDEESCDRNLKERLSQLTPEKNLDIEILTYADFNLQGTDEIVQYCLNNNIELVMIDSLIRVHGLKDENSSAEASKIFAEFKKFKKNNITLILLHHNRKSGINREDTGEEMRGSSELFAFLDCALSFQNKNDGIVIQQTKLRTAKESLPFMIKFIDEENPVSFEFMGYTGGYSNKEKSGIAEDKIIDLLEKNGIEMPRQDIFIALDADCRPHTIKKALNYLTIVGKITRAVGKGNSHLYSLNKLV